MPRKKKNQQPTIEEVRTLREQAEGYIFDVVSEFESISGLTVKSVVFDGLGDAANIDGEIG